jgi:hypothetical protein
MSENVCFPNRSLRIHGNVRHRAPSASCQHGDTPNWLPDDAKGLQSRDKRQQAVGGRYRRRDQAGWREHGVSHALEI